MSRSRRRRSLRRCGWGTTPDGASPIPRHPRLFFVIPAYSSSSPRKRGPRFLLPQPQRSPAHPAVPRVISTTAASNAPSSSATASARAARSRPCRAQRRLLCSRKWSSQLSMCRSLVGAIRRTELSTERKAWHPTDVGLAGRAVWRGQRGRRRRPKKGTHT